MTKEQPEFNNEILFESSSFQNKMLIRNRRWKQKWTVNDENLPVLDYLKIVDVCICLAITKNIVKLVKAPMKTDTVPTKMKELYKQLFILSRILFGSLWCVENFQSIQKTAYFFFLEGETAPGLRLIDCWIGLYLMWTIGFKQISSPILWSIVLVSPPKSYVSWDHPNIISVAGSPDPLDITVRIKPAYPSSWTRQ